MQSSWWLNTTLMLGCLFQLGILASLVARRLITQWPSLFCFSIFSLCAQALIYSQRPHYLHFFWAYWCAYPIFAAFRLWISYDVLRRVPGADQIPGVLRSVVICAGLAMAIGSWASAAADSTPLAERVSASAILFARSVQIGTISLLLACAVGVALSGLRWPQRPARVALGLAGRIVFGYISMSLFTSTTKNVRIFGNYLDSVAEMLYLAFWAVALYLPDATPELSADEQQLAARLKRSLSGSFQY